MCVVCVFFYICAFYAVFFLKHIDVLVCFSFLYVDNFGVALLHDCVSYFTYEPKRTVGHCTASSALRLDPCMASDVQVLPALFATL